MGAEVAVGKWYSSLSLEDCSQDPVRSPTHHHHTRSCMCSCRKCISFHSQYSSSSSGPITSRQVECHRSTGSAQSSPAALTPNKALAALEADGSVASVKPAAEADADV